MAWLRRILPMQRRYAASLAELSRPVWEEAADREEIGKDGLQLGNPRQSLANIRALFGPPLLTEAERVALEEAVCTGGHELAHLYFASGGAVAEEAENRALLTAQGVRARTELRLLVEQLSNAVAVCRQPLPIRSRTGRFQARQAWRAEWLQDGRVFELSQNEPQAGFEVTVLLDGSESRQGQQGLLAVQGYIIASALRQAGIPVRVLSFASVQDYTVLSELMPLQTGGAAAQAGGPEGVLGYAARGWNRDGLAFRALSAWLKRQTVKRTLLLVLTDARPSDALGLARPYLGAQHAYMGKAATEDTAQAVRELRAQGVKVIALIESVASKARALEAARAIYGQGFIYLTGLDGLAGAVSRLVLAELSR